ncbi:hypothetical protein [Magnetospira sp. QH-2]|uniref:hypothetical protein n=1 Tax=Magnetospira sp. (strain QH-2) TaxID=1288970 RepID=UPI0011DD362C|nr:hypothetical protein [Magnetospira sp. QH-2]
MKTITVCLLGTAAILLLSERGAVGDNPWRSNPGWQQQPPAQQNYQQQQPSAPLSQTPYMENLPKAPLMQHQGGFHQQPAYPVAPQGLEYPPDDLEDRLDDQNNRRFGPGSYGQQQAPAYPRYQPDPRSSSSGYVYEQPARRYWDNPTVDNYFGPHEFSPYGGGSQGLGFGAWPYNGGAGQVWPGYSNW